MSDVGFVTEFVYPPIPIRRFDWSARYADDDDEGAPRGWGETEQDAIDDLTENHPRSE